MFTHTPDRMRQKTCLCITRYDIDIHNASMRTELIQMQNQWSLPGLTTGLFIHRQ